MEQLDQLQKEWILVNASRELLSITKKRIISYKESIEFSKENAEELFKDSKTGLFRKDILDKLYDKYKQEAKAKSIETGEEVRPKMLIENRLAELETLLSYYPQDSEDPDGLKKEKETLRKLLRRTPENILGLERITENQAIIYDSSFAKRANKVFINSHLGKYNTYLDKENQGVFRISILHPNPSEAITGADLIYEQYDVSKRKVRIAAIQYKIWEKETLYISQAGNILKQIIKMESCFCQKDFCQGNENVNPFDKYRFPFCAAFLRPTDKLQNPNKLITSGHHVPICCLEQLRKTGDLDYKIDMHTIKPYAVNAQSFEELFNSEKIGSRWLDINDLESLYRNTKVLEPNQRIVVHAQNAI